MLVPSKSIHTLAVKWKHAVSILRLIVTGCWSNVTCQLTCHSLYPIGNSWIGCIPKPLTRPLEFDLEKLLKSGCQITLSCELPFISVPCASIDCFSQEPYVLTRIQWNTQTRQEMYISWYSSVTYTIHTMLDNFFSKGRATIIDSGGKDRRKLNISLRERCNTYIEKSSRNQGFTKLDLQKFLKGGGLESSIHKRNGGLHEEIRAITQLKKSFVGRRVCGVIKTWFSRRWSGDLIQS